MIFLPPLDRRRLQKCHDASVLWGLAKGARIAVACPGPSFEKGLADLKRADLIVSALRAAPLVKSAWMNPHIVVAAGFQGYFVPENLPSAIYVVDLRTHPAVVDKLPGRIFLAMTDWDAKLGVPIRWISGSSSALAALDVAGCLGASAISLVGWDILQSRDGTPGKNMHAAGLQKFLQRFPTVAQSGSRGPRRSKFARDISRTAQQAKPSVSWICRLDQLADHPDFWRPFWGPDYSSLGMEGNLFRKLLDSQWREKRRVAAAFRRLGYG